MSNVVTRLLLLLVVVAFAAGVYGWQAAQPPAPKRAYTPPNQARQYVTVEVQVTATPNPANVVTVYVTATPDPVLSPPTPTPVISASRLLEEYGDEQYASSEAMPPMLFHYYSNTVNAAAAFFQIRAEDLLVALATQNDGMYVLRNDRPEGLSGIPIEAWNGWAYPLRDDYLSDVRLIAQHGGLGFDWRQRLLWQQWAQEESDSSNLNGAMALPTDFDDSVATLAHYLARSGVTAAAATADPDGSSDRLTTALARLQSGVITTLPVFTTENPETIISTDLRDAFNRQLDQTWGVQFSEVDFTQTVDRSPIAAEVLEGSLSAEEGATQLVNEFTAAHLLLNQARLENNEPLLWPFIHDEQTLSIQLYVVQTIGHTLTPWEIDTLIRSSSNSRATLETRIAGRADAQLFTGAKNRLDESLQLTAQGQTVSNVEVSKLVLPVIRHHTLGRMASGMVQEMMDGIEYRIRTLPEFQVRNGKLFFAANPLEPFPDRIGLGFNAPADYQPGGRHTGIDVRGTRDGGSQPLLFAVDDGVVAHMGALYCLGPNVCRGPYAIVLDHGGNVYSIYSHNSEAFVNTGDTVTAGQAIGRQGSEGYSRGSHLHFEIHVGAPYSGTWQEPFRGGEFINPMPWLPRDFFTENENG